MSELTDTMKGMQAAFNPEAARGINARIQLNASGEGGGNYTISIADGKSDMTEGVDPDPTATVTVSAQDWVRIMRGELDPTAAFFTGRLKLSGDMGLMMKFQKIFSNNQ
jgi:putative sterol carrier protein